MNKCDIEITCKDCGCVFLEKDAEWCIHYQTVQLGSKSCPQCHACICHGETRDQIQERFADNLKTGKFVTVPSSAGTSDLAYCCKTNRMIPVGELAK